MNGLELSRGYYEEYGRPMLEQNFPDMLDRLAVGFVGSGSEHFGYDDDVSRDHDFEPGFCIFLPGEDIIDRRTAFLLERAYAKLPKEYCGVRRQPISPVGGNRNGPIRTADFYTAAVGTPDGQLSTEAWLTIPDHALAEATNGAVFSDPYGEFSAIREALLHMPEDVRRKRIAGNLLLMAQSGQYNFLRCLRHGDPDAAQLACFAFTEAAMKTVFLLHGCYLPFYKWRFRALRELPGGTAFADVLAFLLRGDNRDEALAQLKYERIETLASAVIDMLVEQNLTRAVCGDLEKHAYSVNDSIADSQIRNLHILAAV